MKKIIVSILLLIITVGVCFAVQNINNTSTQNSYIRIHIRANSNSSVDQAVKYKVKDSIVAYLTPILSECTSLDDVKTSLTNSLSQIESVADSVLADNGFDYKSNANINNEFFPSRYYESVLLPSDYYDALIVNLGTGLGDNWWCVVYPPLCFVGGTDVEGDEIIYKSKLMELIEQFFNNN